MSHSLLSDRSAAGHHSLPADGAEMPVDGEVPSFAELGLPSALVSALLKAGIERPFAIQAAALPDALAGRDVLGRGQTGSGKTLAFGLPMLARLAGGRAKAGRPGGLVLVPTRELAEQVQSALEPLARAVGLRTTAVVGGVPYRRQVTALRRGVDVMIATPGRLADLVEQGECALDEVRLAVLDEADQMCDMGFMPAVTALLDQVAPGGQRMLFSATLDGEVDSLVTGYLVDPVTHAVGPARAAVSTMEHHMLYVAPRDKPAVTARIAGRDGRTLMFVRTRTFADKLVEQLRAVGVRARALHGGKTQAVRTRTMTEFRDGRVTALVATDVAARGIHVDDVSLVLHVDPAEDPKDYLHRAGRTARAGASGTVVTLVMPRQRRSSESITRQAGVQVTRNRISAEDELLATLTGAREPSGEPVPPDPEPQRRPKRPDRPNRTDPRSGRKGGGHWRGKDGERNRSDRRQHGTGAPRSGEGFTAGGGERSADGFRGRGKPAGGDAGHRYERRGGPRPHRKGAGAGRGRPTR